MFNLDKAKSWLGDPGKSNIRVKALSLISLIFLYPLLCILYYKLGFSPPLLISFCVSVIVISIVFAKAERASKYSRGIWTDIGIALVITVAFAPFYIFLSYEIPFQINSDELVTMYECKRLIYGVNSDLLGVSENFFYIPAGSFIIYGYIAEHVGGLNLQTFRQVSGFFGLCIIFCGYLLFRTFYTRKYAVFIAFLFGCSHVLLGLSRMALRENQCLLVEVIALIILVKGLKQVSFRKLYIGGTMMGLLMYTHYSGRIVPLMWLVFLLIYSFRQFRSDNFLRNYFKLMLPSLLGFLLVATPVLISTSKAPQGALDYPKDQLLIYARGREFIRDWERTNDIPTALFRNTFKGLTTFNNNQPDGSVMYVQVGNGFVDPLTGIFLWLGVFAVIRRRKKSVLHVLTISGFLFTWLFISFLTTKNPAFPRLLVILPFVTVLSFEGIKLFTTFLSRIFVRRKFEGTLSFEGIKPSAAFLSTIFAGRNLMVSYRYKLITLMTVIIVLLNASLYAKYVSKGLRNDELPAGATIRYVDAHKGIADLHYYFSSDDQHLYHSHGGNAWIEWIRLSLDSNQTIAWLPPRRLLDNSEPLVLPHPAVILLSKDLWELSKQRIMQLYPDATIYFIDHNRKHVAIEIIK